MRTKEGEEELRWGCKEGTERISGQSCTYLLEAREDTVRVKGWRCSEHWRGIILWEGGEGGR